MGPCPRQGATGGSTPDAVICDDAPAPDRLDRARRDRRRSVVHVPSNSAVRVGRASFRVDVRASDDCASLPGESVLAAAGQVLRGHGLGQRGRQAGHRPAQARTTSPRELAKQITAISQARHGDPRRSESPTPRRSGPDTRQCRRTRIRGLCRRTGDSSWQGRGHHQGNGDRRARPNLSIPVLTETPAQPRVSSPCPWVFRLAQVSRSSGSSGHSVKSDKELESLTSCPGDRFAIPFDPAADDAPSHRPISVAIHPRSRGLPRASHQLAVSSTPTRTQGVRGHQRTCPRRARARRPAISPSPSPREASTVILVEADLRRPRIPEYLKVEASVGLTTVLVGRIDLDEAIQTADSPGLDVLTSGRHPPNPAELLKTQAMSEPHRRAAAPVRRGDHRRTAAPPVTDAALVAAMSDGALLVIRYGKTTRDQVRAAEARLEAVNSHPAGVMLNMTPARRRGLYGGYGYGYGYGYAPVDTKAQQSKGAGKRTGAHRSPFALIPCRVDLSL